MRSVQQLRVEWRAAEPIWVDERQVVIIGAAAGEVVGDDVELGLE